MNNKTVKNVLKERNDETLNVKDLFYDWFCEDYELEDRGQKLLDKLEDITVSHKFDIDNTYVFFTNNCTGLETYDTIKICNMNGDVIFTVIPENDKGESEVWGKENDFNNPLVQGCWRMVKMFFNV